MKTKSLLLAVVAASVASTVAFGAVSSNIVGYTKLSLLAGNNLVANTLNAANNGYHTLLASAPDNTTVLIWNGKSFNSDTLIDHTSGLWSNTTDVPLNPGQAVFVQVDAAATVYLVGEVQQQGSVALTGNNAFNFVSSVLPIAGDLVKDLGYTPVDGDTVFKWNNSKGAYDANNYIDGLGWTGPGSSAPQLAIGEGIVLQTAKAATWTQTLPASN